MASQLHLFLLHLRFLAIGLFIILYSMDLVARYRLCYIVIKANMPQIVGIFFHIHSQCFTISHLSIHFNWQLHTSRHTILYLFLCIVSFILYGSGSEVRKLANQCLECNLKGIIQVCLLLSLDGTFIFGKCAQGGTPDIQRYWVWVQVKDLNIFVIT